MTFLYSSHESWLNLFLYLLYFTLFLYFIYPETKETAITNRIGANIGKRINNTLVNGGLV